MSTLRDRLLADANWYHRFKQIIRADKATRTIVEGYVRPSVGDRILDIGCGDGDIRPLLGDVDYTGVDLNDDYLDVAAHRSDETTRFVRADVAELSALGLGPFDRVIAIGLLHHLDDDACSAMLTAARGITVDGGRLVTVDPVFAPDQRTTARVLAALDRGRHVREASGYERLIGAHFEIDRVEVRHDLLPFPYSHVLVEARAR